jgi:hypothetical protein
MLAEARCAMTRGAMTLKSARAFEAQADTQRHSSVYAATTVADAACWHARRQFYTALRRRVAEIARRGSSFSHALPGV